MLQGLQRKSINQGMKERAAATLGHVLKCHWHWHWHTPAAQRARPRCLLDLTKGKVHQLLCSLTKGEWVLHGVREMASNEML